MTSSLRRLVFNGSLLVCALSASAARADLPPPAGFVETCTVEHETTPDKACVLCGDAYYAHPDACSVKLTPTGYTQSCRSHGASTWKVAPGLR